VKVIHVDYIHVRSGKNIHVGSGKDNHVGLGKFRVAFGIIEKNPYGVRERYACEISNYCSGWDYERDPIWSFEKVCMLD
jgi:hypothetical protein